MRKYKVGDLVKIVSPYESFAKDYLSIVRNRVCKIVKIVDGRYPYLIKFLGEPKVNRDVREDVFFLYCDKEIIRISAEEAMLEIL